jgi:hypothetical protein
VGLDLPAEFDMRWSVNRGRRRVVLHGKLYKFSLAVRLFYMLYYIARKLALQDETLVRLKERRESWPLT